MTIRTGLELAVALLLIGGGAFAFRRGDSQSAVIMLVVGAIVAIHAFRLLEYHPLATEIEAMRKHA